MSVGTEPCSTVQLLDFYTKHFDSPEIASGIILSLLNVVATVPGIEQVLGGLIDECLATEDIVRDLPSPRDFVLPGVEFFRVCKKEGFTAETRDLLLRTYLTAAAQNPQLTMHAFLEQVTAPAAPPPAAPPEPEEPPGDWNLVAGLVLDPAAVSRAVTKAAAEPTPSWARGPLLEIVDLGHGLCFSEEIVGGGNGQVYTSTTVYERATGKFLHEFPSISSNIEIGIFRTCSKQIEYKGRKVRITVSVTAQAAEPPA